MGVYLVAIFLVAVVCFLLFEPTLFGRVEARAKADAEKVAEEAKAAENKVVDFTKKKL